jgi:hypothetical protein
MVSIASLTSDSYLSFYNLPDHQWMPLADPVTSTLSKPVLSYLWLFQVICVAIDDILQKSCNFEYHLKRKQIEFNDYYLSFIRGRIGDEHLA